MEACKPVEAVSELALKVGIAVGSLVIGTLDKIYPIDNPLEQIK